MEVIIEDGVVLKVYRYGLIQDSAAIEHSVYTLDMDLGEKIEGVHGKWLLIAQAAKLDKELSREDFEKKIDELSKDSAGIRSRTNEYLIRNKLKPL